MEFVINLIEFNNHFNLKHMIQIVSTDHLNLSLAIIKYHAY